MFVLNMRLGSRKKLTAAFLAGAVVIAVICVLCMISVNTAASDTATCDELGEYSVAAENEDAQINFLKGFGLDAEELVQRESVTIPYEFNEVYEEYNALQKEIGLDLSRYRGETADKVKYRLNSKKADYAVLLVCNGRVIGGHLTNGEYGGENLPLI